VSGFSLNVFTNINPLLVQLLMEIVKKLEKHLILILSLALIIVLKIPHLFLPYSWDEAWSYYPAILKMVENGPGIIPGAIPILSSKGHPLLFYFLTSGWITLFSVKIWVVRLFPLIVSLLSVTTLYHLATRHLSKKVANYSVMIFSVQALFLAQSTLVLPEVMLTLFLLLSLHFYLSENFYLSEKIGLYVISASLMVLTKETGLVFAFGFGVFFLIQNLKNCLQKESLRTIGMLFIPLIVFLVHLLLNYRAFHTFFFNEHLELMKFDFVEIKRILKSATAILFTLQGRNTILFASILSLVIILARKQKIQHGTILLLLLLQITLLLVFSSVNFYTYRYILPAFPLFILIATGLLTQAKKYLMFLFYPMLIVTISVPLYYTLTKKGNTDIDLGYSSYLPLHKEVVEYCEQQEWYEKNFWASFSLSLALRDPFTGYHKTTRGYKIIAKQDIQKADILILDSTGSWKELPKPLCNKFHLLKRFENKNHWAEIYQRNIADTD